MIINCAIQIYGSIVILVPYKQKHVEKYHLWMQNEELLELTASEPLTIEEEYQMQESWFKDEDKCTFIVLDKQKFLETNDEVGSMIGDVNLYLNVKDDPNAAEIEIMIAEVEHRSKGKGKEALLLMMRYGTETLKLNKFIAKVKQKNERSIQLFRKLGFKERSRSDYFQEIEMVYKVDENAVDILNNVKCYEIKEYLY